ncbi:MAG: AAA family ATPase [Treponema sp.]|nr:AAA family ATPase [Treponema sp.]
MYQPEETGTENKPNKTEILLSDSLFEQIKLTQEPLAARMRPRNLDEYIGQDHIVGKGRLLRRAIAADQLTSVIFYGPPGSGKTTLARVIANHTKSNFITLNAVLTGVADIRGAIKQAEDYYNLYSRRTILFVDEVHRWNKSQQDALLPWVENGTIILIGATTENPFFEVNKALVSRSRVFQLKPLTYNDLEKAAHQALTDVERGYGHWKVEFEEGALEHLIETANGDARSLLNALELAIETTPEKWSPYTEPPVPAYGTKIYISKEAAEESIQKKVVLYDRDGDYHYDIISAFIKSLRGRDPDAACYWLARMVAAGEDPHFIFRRMLISACEDTGLADPNAISVVESCAQAFDRVGMPEGRYFLAHAALYLSTAPKSNSSMAFFDALASVEKEDAEVPNHLRDSSRDAEGFGHGAGYLYPHAYRDHWVAQQYLPDTLSGRVFYNPSTQGYEATIRNDVLSRREIQIAAILEKAQTHEQYTSEELASSPEETGSINVFKPLKNKAGDEVEEKSEYGENPISEWWINEHFKSGSVKKEENLTFSPKDPAKEVVLDRADRFWRQRLDSNRAEVLLGIRDTMTSMADLMRHHRSLIWNADSGLLLWEIARKTPEGVTCGVCRTEKGMQILEQYGRTLGSLDRPILQARGTSISTDFLTQKDFYNILVKFQYNGVVFDRMFFTDPFASEPSIIALADSLCGIMTPQKDADGEDTATAVPYSDTDKDDKSGEEFVYECPLADGWKVVISQKIPCHGQHISELVRKQILPPENLGQFRETLDKMEAAEQEFFGDRENPLFSWDGIFIANLFRKRGFTVRVASQVLTEKRRITPAEIEKWFSPENSAYGAKMCEAAGSAELQKIVNLMLAACDKTIFEWRNEISFFTIEKN